MKTSDFINRLIVAALLFFSCSIAWAGTPVWTFQALTPTKVTVQPTDIVEVQYLVTNQSKKTHTLVMRPISGILQDVSSLNCQNPFILKHNESCLLNLKIIGSQLQQNIEDGPVVCEKGNPLECYQPSCRDTLSISKGTVSGFTVGGSLYGLKGTLVLLNNGDDALTLNVDGTFTFPTSLASGSAYDVTVGTDPSGQTCTVDNGTGVITNANITSVAVHCSASAHTVGGTISGLSGTVVLQNNGDDNLTLNSNGTFTFATPVAEGATYLVTVLTQPTGQTCTVDNDSGTMGTTDVTNVSIICSANAHTVGGTISGLSGTIVLQNNGVDNLTTSSNGPFTFATPVAQGATYDVTILSEPPTQDCSVSNASGTMGSADVTNVGVLCTTNTTTITPSTTYLALSVTGLIEYGIGSPPPQSSGVSRILTFNNTGSVAATNVSTSSSGFPAGTSITANTCTGTLSAGTSCSVTITPGSIASSDGTNPCDSGTAPIPGVVQLTSDNASPVSANVVVLGYSCVYQNGFVFAFDDTTPNTTSVAGKLATTEDQGNFDWLEAIDACELSISGHTDWYLPPICEMGYDSDSRGSGCGTLLTPTLQNMQSSLVDHNHLDLFVGPNWSSTVYSLDATDAWRQLFQTGNVSDQRPFGQNRSFSVRCARNFT